MTTKKHRQPHRSGRPAGTPPPTSSGPLSQANWPWILAILALTILAFWPALGGDFVEWDDSRNFLTNLDYRGLGLDQLKWAWTTTLMGHYIPVTWMTLELDYVLWGMDARGYHLTNVLLHAANAGLLYLVALRVMPPVKKGTARKIVAAGAALIFAVHPLRVESVAWVTERRDVLSLFFVLLATLAYLRQVDEPRLGKWYGLTLLAFATALLSKASVLTFPAVLVLLNWYPLDRLRVAGKRVALELTPLFVMSAMAAVTSIFALALEAGTQLAVPQKLAVSAYSLWFYLAKSAWPLGLAALYPMPVRVYALSPNYLAAYAGVVLAAIALVLARKRVPGLVAAMLAFFILVSPFLGVVQNGPQVVADRYAYLAGIPLALLVASLLARLEYQKAVAAGATIVGLLMIGTWHQSATWMNSEQLWRQVLAVDSTSSIAHNNLGTVLAARGDRNAAIIHFQEAIRLNPEYHDPYNNIGIELAEVGRLDESIAAYQQALRLRPNYSEAESNLANVLAMKGDFTSAIPHYERAAALDPNAMGTRFNWALTLLKAGQVADAKLRVEEILRRDPQMADAQQLYGELLAMRAPRPSPKRQKGRG